MSTRLAVALLVLFLLALPLCARTYKTTYSDSCGEMWPAVKEVLNDAEHYTVVSSDDAKMTATYKAKHAAHVTVTGTFTQRDNHVTLVPKANACEMQVISNFSGWEHSDRGDFNKRVEAAVAKSKAAH